MLVTDVSMPSWTYAAVAGIENVIVSLSLSVVVVIVVVVMSSSSSLSVVVLVVVVMVVMRSSSSLSCVHLSICSSGSCVIGLVVPISPFDLCERFCHVRPPS